MAEASRISNFGVSLLEYWVLGKPGIHDEALSQEFFPLKSLNLIFKTASRDTDSPLEMKTGKQFLAEKITCQQGADSSLGKTLERPVPGVFSMVLH